MGRTMHQSFRLSAWFYALILSFLCTGYVMAEEELLPPEQAFGISGRVIDTDALTVTWDIAEGYYLYRDKIRFRAQTQGIELGDPEFPPATIMSDEFFGDVKIFRGRLDIRVPLQRSGEERTLSLEASSQGCADLGVCYQPQRQNLLLELPAATPLAAVPPPETNSPFKSPLAALSELGRDLGLANEDDILDPEEAFRFDAMVEAPDRLRLLWAIADGTYLYQEGIHIELEDAQGVTIGAFELPEAKIKPDMARPDGSIGDVAIYQHEIDLRLPLLRGDALASDITLVARFQGCAERGICYPPITKRVALALPIMDTAAAAITAVPAVRIDDGATRSETDRITDALNQGDAWLVIGSFFGFGLLLAFTPCVFPMIPILSGIIAGQGKHITTRKAFILSLVYVLAMAMTYTVAGVLAGLFGGNLQAAFQNPWILSGFALLFVGLALSMFGFYELQLPSAMQSRLTEMSNKQEGGTLIGVAIMGLLSALIVGPCVAPPLAGALIFIGQTGDWALGGVALFAMSIGMGAPLIAIGASAGKLLPRAGGWMDAVKAVFGVMLLGVAIVMLERIIPAQIAMLFWGVLLICSAVYMGALRNLPVEASGWDRLWKGLGLVLFIYGALMLVGAAAGGRDTLQPLRGLAPAGGVGGGQQHPQFKRIKTVADLERELAAASDRNQPVLVDFYADWCVSCKEMARYTFSDAGVIQALAGFTLLQADVTANDAHDQALLQGHFGLPGPPAIMFFGSDGTEKRGLRVVGFMPAQEFKSQIQKAVR